LRKLGLREVWPVAQGPQLLGGGSRFRSQTNWQAFSPSYLGSLSGMIHFPPVTVEARVRPGRRKTIITPIEHLKNTFYGL